MIRNRSAEALRRAAGSLRALRRHRLLAVVCASALLSSSCFVDAGTGGRSGTGISQGSISSFGSIFVNGVEWELSSATIEIDGRPATEADLRVGMVVRIEGVRAGAGLSGTADRVVFDDSVEGPVDDLQDPMPGIRAFEILGIAVRIEDGWTRFGGGASFAGLAEDDVVEVTGFIDALGGVRATRVDLVGMYPAVDEAELKGTISGLDVGNDSFWLGSVFVRYDEGTTLFADLAGEADLADGLYVEVEGTLVQRDELDAAVIEREEGGLGAQDSDDVHLEGLVTSVAGPTAFQLSGVPVDASAAEIDPPGHVVAVGDRLEVEGALVGGTLVADSVELEDQEDDEAVLIVGAASAIDGVARTIELLGVTVRTDGKTEIEDESAGSQSGFGFDDIQLGDWLEVRGGVDGGGDVLAKKLERDDPGSELVLQGPVTAVEPAPPFAQNALWILGVAIPIDAGTQYEDGGGAPIGEAAFFDPGTGVAPGDSVRVVDDAPALPSALGDADVVSFEVE